MTVPIYVQEGGGLGGSEFFYYEAAYADIDNGLIANNANPAAIAGLNANDGMRAVNLSGTRVGPPSPGVAGDWLAVVRERAELQFLAGLKALCTIGVMIGRMALSALILLPAATFAQICALGPHAASYKQSSDERPSADALELVKRADAAAGRICGTTCPPVVLFRNPTSPNLMLLVDAGRAKIVYSPQTFSAVYEKHGDAGIAALIAHELGHALDEALGAAWIEKAWGPELRADAWAGCVLAKDNWSAADLGHATSALSEYPSPAHPAWNARLGAIRSGYSHCGGTAQFPAR